MTQQIPALAFGRISPLSNITPFTQRDGATYLNVLYGLKDYVENTLYKDTVAEIDKLIEAVNSTLADTEVSVKDEFDKISRQIGEITARAGIPPIYRETVSANYTLNPQSSWSRNYPVYVSLVQDNAGNRTVTLGSSIRGVLDVDKTARATTNFWLVPDNTGQWVIQQTGSRVRGGQVDLATTALLSDSSTYLRVALEGLINTFVDEAKAEINREVTRQWSDLSSRIALLER